MSETRSSILDDLLGTAPTDLPLKTVSATVLSATPDVALLEVRPLEAKPYEAVMPVTEFYPTRRWAVGQTYTLLQVGEGSRPMLSAARLDLVEHLVMGLCPEVRSGAVRIMGIARSVGVRTKIAVAATEEGVDPVASLVGRNANRVKALMQALQGERIDVIPWNADQATYLKNALLPAAVSEVKIEGEKATAVAPGHQMSAAVGGGGLNSALAGELTGLHVFIVAG